MLLNGIYYGKIPISRAYKDGQIIWSAGNDIGLPFNYEAYLTPIALITPAAAGIIQAEQTIQNGSHSFITMQMSFNLGEIRIIFNDIVTGDLDASNVIVATSTDNLSNSKANLEYANSHPTLAVNHITSNNELNITTSISKRGNINKIIQIENQMGGEALKSNPFKAEAPLKIVCYAQGNTPESVNAYIIDTNFLHSAMNLITLDSKSVNGTEEISIDVESQMQCLEALVLQLNEIFNTQSFAKIETSLSKRLAAQENSSINFFTTVKDVPSAAVESETESNLKPQAQLNQASTEMGIIKVPIELRNLNVLGRSSTASLDTKINSALKFIAEITQSITRIIETTVLEEINANSQLGQAETKIISFDQDDIVKSEIELAMGEAQEVNITHRENLIVDSNLSSAEVAPIKADSIMLPKGDANGRLAPVASGDVVDNTQIQACASGVSSQANNTLKLLSSNTVENKAVVTAAIPQKVDIEIQLTKFDSEAIFESLSGLPGNLFQEVPMATKGHLLASQSPAYEANVNITHNIISNMKTGTQLPALATAQHKLEAETRMVNGKTRTISNLTAQIQSGSKAILTMVQWEDPYYDPPSSTNLVITQAHHSPPTNNELVIK